MCIQQGTSQQCLSPWDLPPVEMGRLGDELPRPPGRGLPEPRAQSRPVQRKCGRCRRGPEPRRVAGTGPRCFRFQRVMGPGFSGEPFTSSPAPSRGPCYSDDGKRPLAVAHGRGVCTVVPQGRLETPGPGGWVWCRVGTARAGKPRDAQGSPQPRATSPGCWVQSWSWGQGRPTCSWVPADV